jgi:hypothetical protein
MKVKFSFFAFAAVLLLASLAQAQIFRGSISGSVYDSTGAAVPGVTIQLLENSTGTTSSTTSTSAGTFTFPDLMVGAYTITVTQAGFATQKINNVMVEVGKATNIPITLTVAAVTEKVEVSATAATLETQQTALNSVVNTQAVQEIPLNGRDYTQLLMLTTGFNRASSQNGNRSDENNWQLDGADNNDMWHNAQAFNQGSISGVAGVLVPIDSIDQFTQQSVGGADFGRNPGSVVDVVIKAGGNQIHGSAYYFNRNEAFAITNPFSAPGSNPMLRNYNTGGSIGGPIKKDKVFLFLGFEKQLLKTPNNIIATVPSQAWIDQVKPLMAKYGVSPNPVMLNFLYDAYPWSQISGAPAVTANYVSNSVNNEGSNNWVGRIDYNFNDRNRFFLRSIVGDGDADAYDGSVFGAYYQAVPSRQENHALVWTSTITNRLVNQLLLGYNFFLQNFDDANHSLDPNSFGMITNGTPGTPATSITGFTYAGAGVTPDLGRTDRTAHVTDDLTYTHGAHTMKFGGEFRHQTLWVHYLSGQRGSFSFLGTSGPWYNPTPPAGQPNLDPSFTTNDASFADFLGGYLGTSLGAISTGNPTRWWHMLTGSAYFADSWQMKPTLNLSFGVRYEYNTPWYDPTHQISTWSPNFSTSLTPPSIAFPGQPGSPISSLYRGDPHEFAPRLGFAWTPKRGGKTVIRGAWGVYYDVLQGHLFVDNSGGTAANSGASRNPGGASPVFNVTNPTPEIIQSGVPIWGSNASGLEPPWGLWAVDQNLRPPYTQNFSINVQQQLTPHTILQVGYVGSQGRKEGVTTNINQPYASPTPYANIQAARPFYAEYPEYAGITWYATAGSSHYNSIQISLRNTSWRGLTGQISYTISHAMDDMSSARNNHPADSHNLAGDWGNADFDTPQAMSGYVVYEFRQFGHSMPRLTQGWEVSSYFAADAGFPFSAESSLDRSNTEQYSDRANLVGSPFTGVTSCGIISSCGVQYFNPAAFTYATPGTFGNTKRNQFRQFGYHDLDFALIKNTKITERVNFQLRFELFNLFNILNLGCLDAGVPDGNFGRAECTLSTGNGAPGIGPGEPFNMQIGLKLKW